MRGVDIIILTTWLLLMLCPPIQAQGTRESMEHDILEKILNKSQYDKRIRSSVGNGTGGPTIVKVNLMIRSIEDIDDFKMEYKVQVNLRQKWTDNRLIYNDFGGQIRYVTLSETDVLWMPDLFIKNERESHGHNTMRPNMYIRIFPDGVVLYSTRISLTLSCPMDLRLYPMDQQRCQFLLASFAHTTEDLAILWEENNPIQITKNVNLPKFTLMQFSTDYCNSRTNTGTYSCLLLELDFWREFSYYLLTIYVPYIMFVVVAYLSFWLDRTAITARVTIATISLAIMSWMSWQLSQSIPPASQYHIKAIDVWTGMCLTFVFGALCIVIVVNFLNPASPDESPKFKNLGRLVDIVSRIAYPAAFLLYNIFYMSKYLVGDHYLPECYRLSCTSLG